MNVIQLLNRLSLNPLATRLCMSRNLSTNGILFFRSTPYLFAEPLKKKKRLDPAVIKQREDRKKKRIEKQIRRLEKNARQLKPIQECEVPLVILEECSKRERPAIVLSEDIQRERTLLQKQWANYKREQHLQTIQMIDRIAYTQQKALDELRKESEELYQEAIKLDYFMMPFKSEGPRETPPIENYDVPDGDYQDVSKKWER